MKRLFFLPLILVMIVALIFGSCAEPEEPTPEPTMPPTEEPGPAPTPTEEPEPTPGGPIYGGNLRIITSAGPRILGYSVEQGPMDLFVLLGCAEKVVEYNDKQELVPHLAESVDIDETAQTITVTLRKGVKFHDGSECNADSIAWNYGYQVENKRIGYLDALDRIEVTGSHTLVFHYKGGYNNQLIMGWLWSPPMYSKEAFEKAGVTEEARIEWARQNISCTGPFMLKEYKRDDHMTLVRFEDYWGGRPYLDSLTYIFIPDAVTASAMMQGGEADMWLGPPLNEQIALQEKGIVRQSGGGSLNCIVPNFANPDSRWADPKLRAALEYALDKPSIAAALGFGFATPLKTLVSEGDIGYDPSFVGHPYDPAKARALLAEAGFPDGFQTKLLVQQGPAAMDVSTAIKSNLDAVGIITEIDIADPGRFYGALYGDGWDELILTGAGVLGDMLAAFHTNFGDQPLTKMSPNSYMVPDELLALSKDSRTYLSKEDQHEAAKKIFNWIAEEAIIIPIYKFPSAFMRQPYVHSTYLQEGGFTFYFGKMWMEEH